MLVLDMCKLQGRKAFMPASCCMVNVAVAWLVV